MRVVLVVVLGIFLTVLYWYLIQPLAIKAYRKLSGRTRQPEPAPQLPVIGDKRDWVEDDRQ